MAPKRKRAVGSVAVNGASNPDTNPQVNPEIVDAPDALRASPDSDIDRRIAPGPVKEEGRSESPLSDVPDLAVEPPKKKRNTAKRAPKQSVATPSGEAGVIETAPKAAATKKAEQSEPADPEAEEDEEADEEEMKEASSRPPPVHSDYLPLPWKGRLGYACLNTYLRYSTPPVFSSRTCRIASILEHRHPLKDPSQPEHPTKNRPDREQPADIARGQKYVEAICLANAKDIIKMIRWNDKYGIKFLRLSSEMFPFASHEEYGYKLAPFASEVLAEAGKVIAELGHRVTTHPGQFTQLGSPRKSVIDNALRDLEYHDELLSLLKLPEQLDRDAVMILHLGGVFGDKEATLNRFRENYARLSQSVKNRLVLENDDVSWSVHELLPICEELNIPMVLDFHHHNIIFDANEVREGTADVVNLYPRIKATWDRKKIKQKMHYSEPTPAAITGRQRRKHNPRVATLPPCAPDMDLMIEAKDKEQAVFELMRTFKLPGYDTFNDMIPHVRSDDNKAATQQANKKKATPKKGSKAKAAAEADEDAADDDVASTISTAAAEGGATLVPEDEVGMGGPDSRVYWPPTMEDWLRPKKREVKKKDPSVPKSAAQKKNQKKAAAEEAAASLYDDGGVKDEQPDDNESDENATPATKKAKASLKAKAASQRAKASALANSSTTTKTTTKAATKQKPAAAAAAAPKKRKAAPSKKIKEERAATTPPSSSDAEEEDDEDEDSAPTLESGDEPSTPLPLPSSSSARGGGGGARKSNRASRGGARVSYQEADVSMDEA